MKASAAPDNDARLQWKCGQTAAGLRLRAVLEIDVAKDGEGIATAFGAAVPNKARDHAEVDFDIAVLPDELLDRGTVSGRKEVIDRGFLLRVIDGPAVDEPLGDQ